MDHKLPKIMQLSWNLKQMPTITNFAFIVEESENRKNNAVLVQVRSEPLSEEGFGISVNRMVTAESMPGQMEMQMTTTNSDMDVVRNMNMMIQNGNVTNGAPPISTQNAYFQPVAVPAANVPALPDSEQQTTPLTPEMENEVEGCTAMGVTGFGMMDHGAASTAEETDGGSSLVYGKAPGIIENNNTESSDDIYDPNRRRATNGGTGGDIMYDSNRRSVTQK